MQLLQPTDAVIVTPCIEEPDRFRRPGPPGSGSIAGGTPRCADTQDMFEELVPKEPEGSEAVL